MKAINVGAVDASSCYRKIAKKWGIPDNEELVVLSIRGQRNEDCSTECASCPRFDECFPQVPESQRKSFMELMNLVGRKADESCNLL
jgi:hypothetical protein